MARQKQVGLPVRGAMLNLYFDREELRRLDDLAEWMELPREEVIRRALAMLQHGAFVWNAPSHWSVGLKRENVL